MLVRVSAISVLSTPYFPFLFLFPSVLVLHYPCYNARTLIESLVISSFSVNVLTFLVSEPDPQKNQKEDLGDRLGRKRTMHPECRRASDWFMIACLRTFIGNINLNLLV